MAQVTHNKYDVVRIACPPFSLNHLRSLHCVRVLSFIVEKGDILL